MFPSSGNKYIKFVHFAFHFFISFYYCSPSIILEQISLITFVIFIIKFFFFTVFLFFCHYSVIYVADYYCIKLNVLNNVNRKKCLLEIFQGSLSFDIFLFALSFLTVNKHDSKLFFGLIASYISLEVVI